MQPEGDGSKKCFLPWSVKGVQHCPHLDPGLWPPDFAENQLLMSWATCLWCIGTAASGTQMDSLGLTCGPGSLWCRPLPCLASLFPQNRATEEAAGAEPLGPRSCSSPRLSSLFLLLPHSVSGFVHKSSSGLLRWVISHLIMFEEAKGTFPRFLEKTFRNF